MHCGRWDTRARSLFRYEKAIAPFDELVVLVMGMVEAHQSVAEIGQKIQGLTGPRLAFIERNQVQYWEYRRGGGYPPGNRVPDGPGLCPIRSQSRKRSDSRGVERAYRVGAKGPGDSVASLEMEGRADSSRDMVPYESHIGGLPEFRLDESGHWP